MSTNKLVDEKYFKIKFTLPEDDGIIDTKNIFDQDFVCELFVDQSRNILLRVFHEPKVHLGEKISFWWQNNYGNLFEKIKVTDIQTNQDLIDVSFTNAYLKRIRSGSGREFYRGDLKFFEIYPSSVELTYKKTNNEDSKFFLNTAMYHLVEEQYFYKMPWHFENKEFHWTPMNRQSEWVKFGDIEFKPELSFNNTNKVSERSVTFNKQATFTIKKNNLKKESLLTHLSLVEDLYSFYCGEVIDHEISKIQLNDSYIYQVKEMINPDVKNPHGIFRWQLGSSPITLLNNIDASHCLENQIMISQIISQFNYALKSNGEARFMIHFSILEKLKMMMSNSQDAHEYEFIDGKGKTNRDIKSIILQIADLIKSPEDQEKYRSEADKKVNPLKAKLVTEQLTSFLNEVEIATNEFEIDIEKVKKIRDKIFHGHKLNDADQDYLNYVNNPNRFPKLVGVLILKYLGIPDIDNINKTSC